jgi:hypothetical protein
MTWCVCRHVVFLLLSKMSIVNSRGFAYDRYSYLYVNDNDDCEFK